MAPYTVAVAGTYMELDARGIPHDGDIGRQTLARVDKYTFRTPDYQLSSAQDYRKGKAGFQQHIWQATLGPDAVTFALHRGNADEKVFKYWVGRFPRAVQHRNLLIALFDVPDETYPGPKTLFPPDASGNAMPSPGPSEEELLSYTVAVFRRDAFDDVVEKGGWIFARKGHGYLALHSANGYRWEKESILQGEGLIADGKRNAWICQLGREAVDGPFDDWSATIADARLVVDDLDVTYDAPGLGEAHVAWEGPFTVAGKEVEITGYRRFDNPYCQSDYESARYEISHDGASLTLDFSRGERSLG